MGRTQLHSVRTVASFLLRAVIVGLAIAFLVVWWKPSLLRAVTLPYAAGPTPPGVVSSGAGIPGAAVSGAPARPAVLTFADAVARAAPAVVNIYTARLITERAQTPPRTSCSATTGRATANASNAASARG